jgi:hypothetical protein
MSATTATHQPADTRVATPKTTTCQTRRHHPVGAASRSTMTRAGVRKPNPIRVPASTSHFVWAFSRARVMAYIEPVRRRASRASGLLKRNIMAATGVSASTTPASSAACAVNHRRTVR